MRRIVPVILAALSLCGVFADDGGSYYPEDWTYGNIYVEEPNDKIALEKELLIVEQKGANKGITALFDFKNTTAQNVTVPCAFPVIVTTLVAVNKNGSISNTIPVENGMKSKLDLLDLATGKRNATKEDFFAIDKKLRTLSIHEYLSEMKKNEITSSTLQPCLIQQDGKKVPILTVGIETSIEKDVETSARAKENSWSQAEEIYTLKLVLHFYHELVFKPSVSSKLTVKYDVDSQTRSYKGTKYHLIYDISTGGTWKGAIKEFIVLTDSGMTPHNSNAHFEVSECFEPLVFYTAQNYKPQKKEFLEFDAALWPSEGPLSIFQLQSVLDEEPQAFVTNVRASSELSGTFKMAIAIAAPDYLSLDANQDENLRNSTYKANTSFDGILFNGWVEGVKGDGIGEWIEFTLTSSVLGPFATNGLRRFHGEYYYNLDKQRFYDEDRFSVFSKSGYVGETWVSNNRIKTMTLSDSSGKTSLKLDFADLFPLFKAELEPDLININAVRNPVFLEKGTYRMTIDSVYKGERWDDTVLGEVWFIPLSAPLSKMLGNDTELFFKKPLLQIIQGYVSESILEQQREMGRQKEYEEEYGW